MIELNETPVRTSRNYNINNIKLENVEIPKKIPEFNNKTVVIDSNKVDAYPFANDANLTYGISQELTEQVNLQVNENLQLVINSKKNANIEIDYDIDDKNKILIDHIEIIANEDTKSTVLIRYRSDEDVEAFHNGIIRVNAKQNAKIDVIVINLLNTKSNNFIAMENVLEGNAKVNYTIVDFGGAHSITNYYSNIIGENADNKLNSIYIGKENQVLDLNYIAELRGAKSNIDIEVQGALKDKAKKYFKGTIDFKKGCKKATGNENESCMLLSDTAKSIALPMLLCSEEDVKGNHSSSAGKIGEKELFYIMSRGFEQKDAMKLMVRAKFNKILENIKDEHLRNQILEEIDKRLD